jgi:hypothetical protein
LDVSKERKIIVGGDIAKEYREARSILMTLLF